MRVTFKFMIFFQETEEKTVLDPLIVEDLHRESLHQKWQAEEEVNASKKDLHYQDVLYDGEGTQTKYNHCK